MANLNNNAAKQLIQVSFEAQPLIHVPLILGNECFMVTQQDVRRIEDTRYITYSKLAPNGQLIPMENPSVLDSKLPDPRILEILNQVQKQQQTPQTCTPVFSQEYQNRVEQSNIPEPMQTNQDRLLTTNGFNCCKNSSPMIASVNQQLDWSKKPMCSTTVLPLHRTISNNTTEAIVQNPLDTAVTSFCNRGTTTTCTTTTTSNTKPSCLSVGGARCELKKRKVLRFCDEC